MSGYGRLCSTCKEVFDTKSVLDLRHGITPGGQSLEKFLTAAEQKCPICYAIWNQSEKHRQAWSNLKPEKWKSIKYEVDNKIISDEEPIPMWVGIEVRHCDPVTGGWSTLWFDLIHPEDKDLTLLGAPPTDIERSTGSPKSLDLAYAWYQNCLSCHDCNKNCEALHMQTHGWLPTRLIDLGEDGEPNWKLRDTSSDHFGPPTPQYLTLSYRWGVNPSLLLTSSTIPAFYAGQPIRDLPQTFKDLVVVARHFKIRYVWIDSLCIIQDSKKDWLAESSTMRHVYANSACNIAASASRDSDGGLFRTRDPDQVHRGTIKTTIASTTPQEYYILVRHYWEYFIHGGALHDRGWIFQEFFLAPRLLYFAESQLLWECFEKQKCEAFPSGIPRKLGLRVGLPKSLEYLLNISKESLLPGELVLPGQMSAHTTELWMEMVDSYTRCQFTRPSDKLLAFDGIAKIFQEVSGDEYIAGMWKSRILDLIDWRVINPTSRAADTNRASSWSWASVDGLILHFRLYLHDPGTLMELLEVSSTPKNEDPGASIAPDYLKLRGAIVSATYEQYEPGGGWIKLQITIRGKISSLDILPYPDCIETKLKGSGEIYFLVSSFTTFLQKRYDPPGARDIAVKRVACLILEPVGANSDKYKRTGHFDIGGDQDEEMVNYLLSLHKTDSREIILV